MSTPRDIRKAAGYSQARAGVESGTSEPTVRLYEANPEHVRADKRALLDALYARLQARERRGAS